MALLDCRISGLHFPLCGVIDYLGFSLTAQSVLPIDRSTIKYGSGDGGHTLHNLDAGFNAKMQVVAKILNLKGHFVAPYKYPEVLFL
jgi:hypothetical protein